MSQDSTPEERTELPTGRRLQELRKDGMVHMSHEVSKVCSILAGFLVLQMAWQWLLHGIEAGMIDSFSAIAKPDVESAHGILRHFIDAFGHVMLPLLLIVLVIGVVASLSVMLQTDWCIRDKWIKWEFRQLQFFSGIMRMFSPMNFVHTLTAVLKLLIILPIGYYGLKACAPEMVMLVHLTIDDVLRYTGAVIFKLFWKIMYVMIAMAVFDYFWTRHQWYKRNKMTRDEVKDERKAVEGDETTKRRIQAKGLQRIMQRIRQSVPQADVVVTNPTHFAVALKYDRDKMNAPMVVAKGRGFLALRIREMARKAGIPVLERRSLARALYASVEVGAEIPRDLFKAVAEVLAYVYRLRNPQRHNYSRP